MNITYTDNLVIGAGVSGLTLSALMSKNSQEVILLERHNLPGGCAGYFSRSGFTFDVGATTLSGMTGIGSLKSILEILDLSLPIRHIDPGLIIHLKNFKLRRASKLQDWIAEQQTYFNYDWIETLWNIIDIRNKEAIGLAKYSRFYPMKSRSDALQLLSGDYLLKAKSLFQLLMSFKALHPSIDLDVNYKQMIDELLLIAAQNNSNKTPALIAYMALSYLEDCWYCLGGMKELAHSLESRIKTSGSSVFYKHEVQNIIQRFDYFEVKTNKQSFRAKRVISSLPIWNTHKLTTSLPLEKVHSAARTIKPKWGAITGYFSLKPKNEITDLYHQIHIETPLSYTSSQSVFVSFCPLGDKKRTKGIEQTVTLSIHIDLDKYAHILMSVARDEIKRIWELEFTKILELAFSGNILNLTCHGIGDPKTFERFTGRQNGSVGGLPHDIKLPLFLYPQFDTGVKNFYQLGDTTFPGQGIVGVMQGALNLFHRFNKM